MNIIEEMARRGEVITGALAEQELANRHQSPAETPKTKCASAMFYLGRISSVVANFAEKEISLDAVLNLHSETSNLIGKIEASINGMIFESLRICKLPQPQPPSTEQGE
jgi:hypothetical protein